MQKATLTEIIIFNRRREGEVSRMKVTDYTSKKDASQPSDILDSLSECEKALCKILTRVEIEGKGGRTVPVLLTPDIKRNIDVLLKYRSHVGVAESNSFLFASCRNGAQYHFRGSDCLRKFSEECGVKNPELIRSTKLRKHVATVTQMLNLQENEVESLARFMGHDIRIHRDYYRLPDHTQQLAKLSKIFLNIESGMLVENSGKTLDDIEVSLEIGTYKFFIIL